MMDKRIEKVEITYSDGTQETYTGNVLVIALDEEKGINCRGSFRCALGEATKVAMTMVMEAGRIFQKSIKEHDGVERMWLEGKEERERDSFSDFFNSS